MICILIFLAISNAVVPFNQSQLSSLKSFISDLCANRIALNEPLGCDTAENTTAPIVCDPNGNLIAINFYRKPCMDGVISQSIGDFERLRTFDIRDAGIVGSIPSEITRCSSLTTLLTAGNYLRNLVPANLISLPLTVCTLMRAVSENNCFACPVPKLTCTATLKCNDSCVPFSTTVPFFSFVTPTTTQSLVYIPSFSAQTTITTKPMKTTLSSSSQTKTTTQQSYTTTTTTASPPTTITNTVGGPDQILSSLQLNIPSTTTFFGAVSTETNFDTTMKKTYERRTFTLVHSETESFESSITESIRISSDGKVSVIIVLACALTVTIPVIFVLVCFYGRSKGKSAQCCHTEDDASIEYGARKKDDDNDNEEPSKSEIRMNVVNSVYGPIPPPADNSYDVVQNRGARRTYDIVPTVYEERVYDAVDSELVE